MADTMLREFTTQLQAFARDDVAGKLEAVFQEAAQTASEAVVIGNAFGPGAPLDTGFLRASFRVAEGAPVDGPSTPPPTPGRKPGDAPIYGDALDTSAAARAPLGGTVFCTTIAEYATYLEEGGMVRRNGPPENRGAATPFVAPVEARWPAIVDDAASRVGFGA
jgi:hypothetical protein